MTAPFYQIKMVVNDIYIEYTTSDNVAMDKFLGNVGEVKETKPLSVVEHLKEAFKGNGEWK